MKSKTRELKNMRIALYLVLSFVLACSEKEIEKKEFVYVHDSLPDTIRVRVDVESSTIRILEAATGDISLFPERSESGPGYHRVSGCEVFDEKHWRCWNDYSDVDGVGFDDSNKLRIYGEEKRFRQEWMYRKEDKWITQEVTYTLTHSEK